MALETDLNVPPYHDDYDPAKNYYRILYRPATAVQARELTQQQTMMQTQIERFGDHMFKDGSIVDGVGILYYPNTHFIAVEDTFSYANGSSANSIFPTSLTTNASIQYLLTNSQDSNNAVRATIKIAKDGTKENANNTFRETNRFYLDYTFTGTDLDGNDVNRFAPGDTVYIYNQNQNKFGTLDANNLVYTVNALSSNSVFDADGYAYLIGCTDGTIYQKGFFSLVNKQVITVRDFSTLVNILVCSFSSSTQSTSLSMYCTIHFLQSLRYASWPDSDGLSDFLAPASKLDLAESSGISFLMAYSIQTGFCFSNALKNLK